jgi:hypothetical protein
MYIFLCLLRACRQMHPQVKGIGSEPTMDSLENAGVHASHDPAGLRKQETELSVLAT